MEAFETEGLAVGMREVLKKIQRGEIEKVIVATDTDTFIRNKVENACNLFAVPFAQKHTKAELAALTHKQVPTAVIGILKLKTKSNDLSKQTDDPTTQSR